MSDKNDFDAVLNMDDDDFAEKLMEAIGVQPGDTVEISTPQFEREDGVTPHLPDAFERLRSCHKETLKAIGCRPWDEPDKDGEVLMLFPYQWYPHIPAGFEVVDINGETEAFRPGETDDDRRCGVLAYGIKVKA